MKIIKECLHCKIKLEREDDGTWAICDDCAPLTLFQLKKRLASLPQSIKNKEKKE